MTGPEPSVGGLSHTDLEALGIERPPRGLIPSAQIVAFRVIGTAAPQAGMRSVRTARGVRRITEGGVNLLPWRHSIAVEAAVAAVEVGCQEGALGLDLTFRFRCPDSRLKWEREAADTAQGLPMIVRPDLDKLERAVCDGLVVGGLIRDDALVCSVAKRKVEVWDSWTGLDLVLNRVRREPVT